MKDKRTIWLKVEAEFCNNELTAYTGPQLHEAVFLEGEDPLKDERARCEKALKDGLASASKVFESGAQEMLGVDASEAMRRSIVASILSDMAFSLDLTARLGNGTGEPHVVEPDPFLDRVVGEWIHNNPLPHRRSLRGLAQHVANAVRDSTTVE